MCNHQTILETKDLSIGYPGKNREDTILFDRINLSAGKAELVALLGANGTGKSTLLRNLVRLQKPLSGSISLFNSDINDFSRNELARRVGFVSTEIIQVNNLKVYDMVALGRSPHTNWLGKLGSEDGKKVNEALSMVGIDNLRDKNINQLSDGERQRAMIARTLAQDTELIVLDEPTAFLDLPNKYEIVHLLHLLADERNKTVIFSTHDLGIAIQEASSLWLMLDGEILQGAPEDLILKGSFGKMFRHTNLRFNTVKGEFRMKREVRGNAVVSGPDPERRWTRNALERLGYAVTRHGIPDLMINIESQEETVKWELTRENRKIMFRSIHELCDFLAMQIRSLPR